MFTDHEDAHVQVLSVGIEKHLDEFKSLSDKLASAKPLPDSQLYLKASSSDNKQVKYTLKIVQELENKLMRAKADVIEAMKASMPKVDVTEMQDIKAKHSTSKSYLTNTCKALRAHAEMNGFDDVVKWVDTQLVFLDPPKKSSSIKNPENEKIRTWAIENGEDIKAKGRISQAVKDKYYATH